MKAFYQGSVLAVVLGTVPKASQSRRPVSIAPFNCFGLKRDLRYNREMRLADLSNPAVWLVGSFLSVVAATNLTWLAIRHRPGLARLLHGPLAPLGWLVMALFYLLPPYLGIREGVLSPYTLGLTEVDWRTTLSDGMALSGIIIGGLVFGWLLYRRSLPEGLLPRGMARLIPALRAPIEAMLHQWHWMFYRAAVAEWLVFKPLSAPGVPALAGVRNALQGDPLYWGAWLGLVVVYLEMGLDPFSRSTLRRSGAAHALIRRVIVAGVTTGLFVVTRNLWLCLIVHVTVETLVAGWFPLPIRPSPFRED